MTHTHSDERSDVHLSTRCGKFAPRSRLVLTGIVALFLLLVSLLAQEAPPPMEKYASVLVASPILEAQVAKSSRAERAEAAAERAFLFREPVHVAVEHLNPDGHHSSQSHLNADDLTPEQRYCRMANPWQWGSDDNRPHMSPHASCLVSLRGTVVSPNVDTFLLIVTTSEDQFFKTNKNATSESCDVSHLSWLGLIRIPTVVFVKSRRTKSFRNSGLKWDAANGFTARSQESMYREANPDTIIADEATVVVPGANGATKRPRFRSVLRDPWAAATSDETERENVPPCQGAQWISEKVSRVDPDLLIFESPNVGDESLSFVEVALRLVRREAAKHNGGGGGGDRTEILDHILDRVEYIINVHDHQQSWHGLDIVAQLGCLCVDASVEAYRTLTSPHKAYLMQCMPLLPADNESALVTLALEGISSEAARQNPEVIAFHKKQVASQNAVSRIFAKAFRYLVGRAPPQAIVRDCCSSFVVTRSAVLEAGLRNTSGNYTAPAVSTFSTASPLVALRRTERLWGSIRRKIRVQPQEMSAYFDDEDANMSVTAGELSMYLERFWRSLLGATEYDTHRDISMGQCDRLSQQQRVAVAGGERNRTSPPWFECPPLWHIRNVRALHPRVLQNIDHGMLACPPEFTAGNSFGGNERRFLHHH